MEIKKYDRFKSGGDAIESLGVEMDMGDLGKTRECFKYIQPSLKAGLITTFCAGDFKYCGFKKIDSSNYTHPLITEISKELKSNPKFAEKLVVFLLIAVSVEYDKRKSKLFALVKQYVPVKWIRDFYQSSVFFRTRAGK